MEAEQTPQLLTATVTMRTEAGGFHTPVRGTVFVRNGAVTPGPSCECEITFFVKGRPKSARQSRDSTVVKGIPPQDGFCAIFLKKKKN